MSAPAKFKLPDGDFADLAERFDRNTDFAARAERKRDEAAREEEREAAAIQMVRRYACAVKAHANGGVTVSTLDHPALVGPLNAWGRDLKNAVSNLRYLYAMNLVRRKLMPTSDEARSYALSAEFDVRVDLTNKSIHVQVV